MPTQVASLKAIYQISQKSLNAACFTYAVSNTKIDGVPLKTLFRIVKIHPQS